MDSLGSAYRANQLQGSPAISDRRGEAANRREAISQLEAVVKVSTEVLGPEHRDTVANQATLAKLREKCCAPVPSASSLQTTATRHA